MRDFTISLAIFLIIFVPAAQAQQYDSASVNSQPSIDNPYSQYNVKYSPNNVNSPYSQYNQSSPKSMSNPFVKEEHDWHAARIIDPEQIAAEKAEKAKKAKEAAEEALARKFFSGGKPKKQIPVFFYLLALSSLAVGATVLIILGSFKK